jgi:hypothetical protein
MFKGKWKIAIAALAALALAAPAMAGPAGKYQSTYVQGFASSSGTGDLQLPASRNGKLKIKQAGRDKDGEGGFRTQILGNAKLTCASNPDSKGLCGPKGSPTEVVALSVWQVLGFQEITNATRLLVTGGKIVFKDTGRNSFTAAGNVAASTIYNTPVLVQGNTIHDLGSDPDHPTTGCEAGPTIDKTTCAAQFASLGAGIMFGIDLTNLCDVDADCGITTLECPTPGGFCAVQTCPTPSPRDDAASDAACNSGECNLETGNCCDPAGSAGCPDRLPPSPSGAFLDANVLY